ncbi:unnamed protein product [Ceratitis capitata]|uniref:(Mediterranean fruit fly) hypothetical protein n=1 Tax=Ceratitis capitata TaxID=7213 RepID=A0A811UIS3_CERCA|nr:unnamed protein product [Ceratitis capitata]
MPRDLLWCSCCCCCYFLIAVIFVAMSRSKYKTIKSLNSKLMYASYMYLIRTERHGNSISKRLV